jgi:Holliday junction DNA helicase RuvA
MISYLQGTLADIQKPGNHKIIVILDVNQIGYELQVPARQLSLLPPQGDNVKLFVIYKLKKINGPYLGSGSGKSETFSDS